MSQLFSYKKTVDIPGWARTIEILAETNSKIEPKHIIKLIRPTVNEERIRENITRKYADEMYESLFADEVKKKIEDEIKDAIKDEEDAIKRLPAPTMFVASWSDIKNISNKWQNIKFLVSKDVAKYFIDNWEACVDDATGKSMSITLESYPFFMDTKREYIEVLNIMNKFLDENEDSIILDTEVNNMTKFLIDTGYIRQWEDVFVAIKQKSESNKKEKPVITKKISKKK